VVAAAEHAHGALGAKHVHLLGYSFGATVAGAALDARDFIASYTAVGAAA
jgi:alpha/beta superfamily hydrolase